MSISKLLLITGAILLFSLPAAAQFGQVDGYILGPDKKPVAGAIIGFDRLDQQATYRRHIGQERLLSDCHASDR